VIDIGLYSNLYGNDVDEQPVHITLFTVQMKIQHSAHLYAVP